MTAPAPQIWTDVDLVPEARRLLADNHTILRVQKGGLEGIATADGIIAGSLLVGDAVLYARVPNLQVLARTGIGHDRVDVEAATAAGVCAVNTPDAPTESTAEFALTLMLATARRLQSGATSLANGQWNQDASLVGFDLDGKTLGLVGCGRIGRRVAELGLALRMEVQAFDPPAPVLPAGVRRAPSLVALLETSDVISLHVPLSPATRHLLGAEEFARCKPGAILINTARGPLVDEAALFAALRSGRLAGAGLDVWDQEPPATGNALALLPVVTATPHMAAFTREGRRRSHLGAVNQVLQVLHGEQPPFLLNPAVWPHRRGRNT